MNLLTRWQETLDGLRRSAMQGGSADALDAAVREAIWSASLVSVADDIPAGALAEAVARNMMTAPWALSCVSYKSRAADRVHAYVELATLADGALPAAVSVAVEAASAERGALLRYLRTKAPDSLLRQPGREREDDIEDGDATRRLSFLKMYAPRARFRSQSDPQLLDRIETAGIRDRAVALGVAAELIAECSEPLRAQVLAEIVQWLQSDLESPSDLFHRRRSETRYRALGYIFHLLPASQAASLTYKHLQHLASSEDWPAYARLGAAADPRTRERAWPALLSAIARSDGHDLCDLVAEVAPYLPAASFESFVPRVAAGDSDVGHRKLVALVACVRHGPEHLRRSAAEAAERSARNLGSRPNGAETSCGRS